MRDQHSLAAMIRGNPFIPFEIHVGTQTFRVISRELIMVDATGTVAVVSDPKLGVSLIEIDHISSCTRRIVAKKKARPSPDN